MQTNVLKLRLKSMWAGQQFALRDILWYLKVSSTVADQPQCKVCGAKVQALQVINQENIWSMVRHKPKTDCHVCKATYPSLKI